MQNAPASEAPTTLAELGVPTARVKSEEKPAYGRPEDDEQEEEDEVDEYVRPQRRGTAVKKGSECPYLDTISRQVHSCHPDHSSLISELFSVLLLTIWVHRFISSKVSSDGGLPCNLATIACLQSLQFLVLHCMGTAKQLLSLIAASLLTHTITDITLEHVFTCDAIFHQLVRHTF